MSSDQRFPSPANVAVDKNGKPTVPVAPKAPPQKTVVGTPSILVQIQYKGSNTIVLPHSVHSIVPGLNQLDSKAWALAQKLPAIQSLLKSGLLSEIKPAAPLPPAQSPAPVEKPVAAAPKEAQK
jgi:hypothetical protein